MRPRRPRTPSVETLEGRRPPAAASPVGLPAAAHPSSVAGRRGRPDAPTAPLFLTLHLAPGEQVPHPSGSNSGGITFDEVVTIEGRTLPGSVVHVDSGLGNYTFTGPALRADSAGRFSLTIRLAARLTNTQYEVVDPRGRSEIRAFPILREVR